LHIGYPPTHFAKIVIPFNLVLGSLQNPINKGLTSKILSCKELATISAQIPLNKWLIRKLLSCNDLACDRQAVQEMYVRGTWLR
jgi:hypothetical protein